MIIIPIFAPINNCMSTKMKQYFVNVGIDDDDIPTEEATSTSVPDEIPPLEGEGEDDASRMEEVD